MQRANPPNSRKRYKAMFKVIYRISIYLPILIVMAAGCNNSSQSTTRVPESDPPKKSEAPNPRDEPRAAAGPFQEDLGTKSDRGPTGLGRRRGRVVLHRERVCPPGRQKTYSRGSPESTPRSRPIGVPNRGQVAARGRERMPPIARYIGAIVLTDIKGDGKAGLSEARLETLAGEEAYDSKGARLNANRLDIGGRQYNIVPGKP